MQCEWKYSPQDYNFLHPHNMIFFCQGLLPMTVARWYSLFTEYSHSIYSRINTFLNFYTLFRFTWCFPETM